MHNAEHKNSYKDILQLKNQLESYVYSNQFDSQLNFGYFFNEYIKRQAKPDKVFASEISVSHATISQYINKHRKPTNEFLIRLELHSCGLFPAFTWLKLLHKETEFQILNDQQARVAQVIMIKKRLDLNGN